MGDLSYYVLFVLREAKRIAGNDEPNMNHILQVFFFMRNNDPLIRDLIPDIDLKSLKTKIKSSKKEFEKVNGDLIIKKAISFCNKEGMKVVASRHLGMALLSLMGYQVKVNPKKDKREVIENISVKKKRESVTQKTGEPTPTLDKFGIDLTEKARKGELFPIVGREKEIEAIILVLLRTFKRNPLLVGPAGVGKTVIVEGLAQRIAMGKVPEKLRNKRIIQLNTSTLISDTQYMGSFEKRITGLMKEASHEDIVLFIDELHTIVGAGGSQGLRDLANLLKYYLGKDEISLIGATTAAEYHRFIEKDEALERRFMPLRIKELSPEDTLQLLRGIKENWEKKGVSIGDDVLVEIVRIGDNYLKNRNFPDKAIDLLDQSVALILLRGEKELKKEIIGEVAEKMTGLLIGGGRIQLLERLEKLKDYLSTRVLGQDEAIEIICENLPLRKMGLDLNPQRPDGVFLFLGPTGTGKTEMAKALAEFLFGSEDRLFRIDMSEFREPHTIMRILGAPPSYIGYDEGSKFLRDIAENPFCVLLLDEIEKAHSDVLKLFLQVFDEGFLTSSTGKRVYFSDSIIVMTSNLKPEEEKSLGFMKKDNKISIREKLKGSLPPEFLNRIDGICLFRSLSLNDIKNILIKRILPQIKEKFKYEGIEIEVGKGVISFLAEKGYSETFGARELKRTVDSEFLNPLVNFISSKVKKEGKILASLDQGKICFQWS